MRTDFFALLKENKVEKVVRYIQIHQEQMCFLPKKPELPMVKNAKTLQNLLPAMQEQNQILISITEIYNTSQEKFDNLKKKNPQVKTQYDFKTVLLFFKIF